MSASSKETSPTLANQIPEFGKYASFSVSSKSAYSYRFLYRLPLSPLICATVLLCIAHVATEDGAGAHLRRNHAVCPRATRHGAHREFWAKVFLLRIAVQLDEWWSPRATHENGEWWIRETPSYLKAFVIKEWGASMFSLKQDYAAKERRIPCLTGKDTQTLDSVPINSWMEESNEWWKRRWNVFIKYLPCCMFAFAGNF